MDQNNLAKSLIELAKKDAIIASNPKTGGISKQRAELLREIQLKLLDLKKEDYLIASKSG